MPAECSGCKRPVSETRAVEALSLGAIRSLSFAQVGALPVAGGRSISLIEPGALSFAQVGALPVAGGRSISLIESGALSLGAIRLLSVIEVGALSFAGGRSLTIIESGRCGLRDDRGRRLEFDDQRWRPL